MKIKLGEKRIVVQGVRPEDNMWGEYQFPRICNNNGELIVEVHAGEDRIDTLDTKLYFKSVDNGKSWKKDNGDNFFDVETKTGDKLFFPSLKGVDVSNYEFPKFRYQILPSDKMKKALPGRLPIPTGEWAGHGSDDWVMMRYTFDRELCPDEFDDMTWTLRRTKKDEKKPMVEKANVEWPHKPECTVRYKNDKELWLGGNWPICDKKLAPDGTIWVTTYTAQSLDPKTGRYSPFEAVYLFVSDDNGKTFKLRSYIPYNPEIIDHDERYMFGGFNESSIEFTDDGSVIMIMRVNDVDHRCSPVSPMYIVRSVDNGYTWSVPVEFDKIGVLPKTCKLKYGAIVAIYGRPGIYVRATEDKSGQLWEEPVEVMTPSDRSGAVNYFTHGQPFHRWAGSCCNCDIVAISDNTALIVYSDFYYPDQEDEGKLRKTILVQEVIVEQ